MFRIRAIISPLNPQIQILSANEGDIVGACRDLVSVDRRVILGDGDPGQKVWSAGVAIIDSIVAVTAQSGDGVDRID